ncbi:hypothetical protein, partial [Ectobacillus panaciterrae]|uniref:hypothetical protein n=1 Tax=Ectobacillus panaciterrae TaxID=363872 RepID=UPI00054ECE08
MKKSKKVFGYVMAGALGLNILGATSTFAASNDIHNTESKTQVQTSVSYQGSKLSSEFTKLQDQAKKMGIKVDGKNADQLQKEINRCKQLQDQA